ncbi:hypothetical protein ADK47_35935 [Streptomyces rimosus subsp. rimosus]|nr:hypothetical protein DF17_05050 [Streptomyces rimosus]KOG69526.1 hypothetical protein ADK78_32520 [Kitasatospora aureofaciens]KOT27733.1 hypothetical protein ADK84_38190 [Streptomyces sp. NRRL WC-3701]KOT28331.1 hypothetical protein ADK42_34705 [Streptomyces rimosus subsp. rimosus]KEF20738.1 hypothetical protein DF18_10025 [Streptomyces rimosus]
MGHTVGMTLQDHHSPATGPGDENERPLDEVAAEHAALMTQAAVRARSCLEVDDLRGAFTAACEVQSACGLVSEALVVMLSRQRLAARRLLEDPAAEPKDHRGGDAPNGTAVT